MVPRVFPHCTRRARARAKETGTVLGRHRWAFPSFNFKLDLTSVGVEVWPFGYVSEVVEHAWAPWVLRRMRAAVEEKVRPFIFPFHDLMHLTNTFEIAKTMG